MQKRFCKCLIKYFYLIICIGYSGQDKYLLFPLYKLETIEITSKNEKRNYVEQEEFGFVSSYGFVLEDEFSIENLCFLLINFDDKQILNKFTYVNQKLLEIKKEPLISYQNGFVI